MLGGRQSRKFYLQWFMLVALLFAALPGQAAINSISQVAAGWYFGRKYARLSHVAEYFNLKYYASTSQFRLISGKSYAAVFYPDKRTATVNGMPVVLNFAPTFRDKMPFISWSDFTETVLPIFQKSALKRHTPKHIVIDPGHGGSDPGAIGKISKEKNITLAISKELKRSLEKRGFKVTMTRTGDATLSLAQRASHCNRVKGQVFVSIHADAADRSVRGIGSFSLTSAGAPSYNTSKVESGTVAGHSWSRNSLYLSYAVQKRLAANIKETPNRGIKRARFSVLRNTECPAILVETGFISNATEERNLNNSAYRKRLAEAIANGIADYQSRVKTP